jgi:hypothetical protein
MMCARFRRWIGDVMGYFFDTFYFEPGSRMTGIWQAGVDLDADAELVATASLVRFGRDQHDQLEADFMGSHLPFHFGGFHGVGPDGHPWAMMLQIAPSTAADLVGSDSVYWPMSDGLDRALHYNWEAELLSDRGFQRLDLVDIYTERGIDPSAVDDWTVPELMLGLLAECCYVPLRQIVAGRITQCAFPDTEHDCQRDVFSDVFARWGAGELRGEEPELPEEDEPEPEQPRRPAKKFGPGRPPEYWWNKKKLRRMSTKKLRRLALSGYWDEQTINTMKRKKLIKLLSTPHWKNEHEKANSRVYLMPPPSLRRFEEDES